MGKVKIGTLIIDVFTAIVRPVILHYQLTVSKLIRIRILKQTDLALASSWEKVCGKIRTLEKGLQKHTRLQLGLETIFQLTGTVILYCYGASVTKTSQELGAMFKQENMTIWGMNLPSNFIICMLAGMNLITFVRVNFSCIVEG